METPGAPPVHTASFCMPPPDPDEYDPAVYILGNSRLTRGMDHRTLSEHSSFPCPSFRLAEDSCYLTIQYGSYGERLRARFHVPLSSLCRSPMQRDTLAILWEFERHRIDYGMSGGRLIHYMPSVELDSRLDVSVFDLNWSRARRLGKISADPHADDAPFHSMESDLWRSEIGMEGPRPVYLASRSFSLDGSLDSPHMICDDEHMISWALTYQLSLLSEGLGGIARRKEYATLWIRDPPHPPSKNYDQLRDEYTSILYTPNKIKPHFVEVGHDNPTHTTHLKAKVEICAENTRQSLQRSSTIFTPTNVEIPKRRGLYLFQEVWVRPGVDAAPV
ncbi:hypothetical protein BS47DRAFT_1392529 [Hydnum rufescens UP504]|uniref:Uncharacterized protein n=1 Tax=Hydnum rufescens UP504 TaxID=1448309 RepID=A0A9P6AYK7_9AGAM|nr:hypothetical protein BS47DRAFT_1392529 [Hydnum rufescens UP504]